MLGPLAKNWRFLIQGHYIAMLFLLTLSLSKVAAKVLFFIGLAKLFCQSNKK